MTGRKPRDVPRRPAAVVAALLLALSVGACYTYTGARYGGDAPLQARLASAYGSHASLDFAVSDRAHVAVFRVHDSGYVRALYPYHPGASSLFRPGAHTVLTPSTPTFRSGWRPGSRFASRLRSGSFGSSAACIGRIHTSYAMIVASRRPLRMSRIRGHVPFRFRRVSFLSPPFDGGTAFGTMDRLLDRLIPERMPREDWDVDWVVEPDVGAPCHPGFRPPLRRPLVAGDDRPPAQDTTSGETRPRRLDTGDLPFSPPGIPLDLPEVAVTGSDGSGRMRIPLPPVGVAPVPRAAPDGKRRRPSVEGLGGIGEEEPGRGRRDAGPESVDGPSDHFGRLFDGGDRPEAEGWIPGWSERRGRAADRRTRDWARDMNEWASDPSRHDFPEPPRPPARWRERGADWPSTSNPGQRLGPGPGEGVGGPGRDFRDVQRIGPPARAQGGRDIEVRRPSTSSDPGGSSDARKSGGESKDRGEH